MNFAAERGATFAMKSGIRGQASLLFLIIVVVSISLSPSHASPPPPRYSVIPLGTPGTQELWSENFFYPQDINNKGDVIGQRENGHVLYRNGTIYELGYPQPPLEHGWSSAINDRGEILGIAFGESAVSFLLSTLPRPLPVAQARILPVSGFVSRDLNDYGAITGYLYDWRSDTSTPVVYHDGRITELPPLVPEGYAETTGLNNRGQVTGAAEFHDDLDRPYGSVGIRAVIWSGRRIHNLGVLPGCYDSYARDINDRGEVVGDCVGDQGLVGFIYRNGVMRPLPSPPGARHTIATRINNAGHVLIGADGEDDIYRSCWLYADGVLHNLVPIVARATRWAVQELHLFEMNDRGEIVGAVQYLDRNGRAFTQGVLLVPPHARIDSRVRAAVSRSTGRGIVPR